jgi:aconitate decarboxylase
MSAQPITSAGVTEELAECIVALKYANLPENVIAVSKTVILDGIANTLAGSVQPLGKILIGFVESLGGMGSATIVGASFKSNPPYAAFANAAFCHSLDYEAMWWPPTHPTSPVLPALLALAESEGIGGRRLLEAFVVGFEVQGRLNLMCTDWFKDPYNYFHPPGSIGAIGSAAACAKLLGLDAWRTRMAIGIAASRAGGLWANSGSMTKSQHSANAARSGVEAALLARAGYDAEESVIEVKKGGFAKVFYGDEADPQKAVLNFGQPFRMIEPGITIKKHPAQTTTHWCIDAAFEIREKRASDPDDIEKVICEVGAPNWSSQWPRPKSGLEGKFSIHYTVALVFLDGEIVIDSFSDARRYAPDMEKFLGKIEVRETKEIPPSMVWPETWARVTVVLKDGTTLEARCDKPIGRGDRPMTPAEQLAKFTDCAKRVISAEHIIKVVELVDAMDRLEDMTELCSYLRA